MLLFIHVLHLFLEKLNVAKSFGNALNSETIPLIAWLTAVPQLACFLFWCGRHICVRLYHLGLLSRLAVCYFCFICTLSTQHRARIMSTVFENRFRSVFQQNSALFDKWHQISATHEGILCFLIWLPLIRDLSKKSTFGWNANPLSWSFGNARSILMRTWKIRCLPCVL